MTMPKRFHLTPEARAAIRLMKAVNSPQKPADAPLPPARTQAKKARRNSSHPIQRKQ